MGRPPETTLPGPVRRSASRLLKAFRVMGVAALISLPLIRPGWCWEALTDAASARCEAAISAAETSEAVPAGLLTAIARVETGRLDPASRTIRPWPWTMNANGSGRMFETKDAVIEAVRALQAKGVRSIDVGCLQINLLHHPQAFGSLEQAFDPEANAAYAAHFLHTLFNETLDWPAAAAAYHSHTPALGIPYRQLVMAGWGIAPSLGLPSYARGTLSVAPRPLLKPFTPPPLLSPLPARPEETERLLALAAECVEADAVEIVSWGAANRAPACSRSPFSSVARLQQALRPRQVGVAR